MNNSIATSDYIKFNTDFDFKSDLTSFLDGAYQQIQDCDDEVPGPVKYMYPEVSLRKQVSNAGTNNVILYDDVTFKVPSVKFCCR
ncbi:hypothetical protein [Lacinutrix sp. Hel_I_90]|uniref:hypothetical protein n=1 Tax=Lacinutrix sp. Hel_I_90 TaxID=1249999 RepID=UPI0005CA25D9|nr:hypothetical protein [Lacinutrix sp. Hel_I_90]